MAMPESPSHKEDDRVYFTSACDPRILGGNILLWENSAKSAAGIESSDESTQPVQSNGNICKICSRFLVLDDLQTLHSFRKAKRDGEIGFNDIGRNYYPRWWAGDIIHESEATPPELPELSRSTHPKCKFCQALKHTISHLYGEHEWWKESNEPLKFRIQYVWDAEGIEETWTQTKKHLKRVKHAPGLSLWSIRVSFSHPHLCPKADNFFEFRISSNNGVCRNWLGISLSSIQEGPHDCESNMIAVRKWLKSCEEEHSPRKTTNPDNLPTRLIDLTPKQQVCEENDSPATIRANLVDVGEILHRSTGIAEPPKYACLSYCWGSEAGMLKTTPATLESHRNEIPKEEMPQAYRDAIKLCQKLGIRYLWIDALCIVQKDQNSQTDEGHIDWERESVKMSDIYAHSVVTFGAAATCSPSDSFLQREPNQSFEVEFRSSIDAQICGTYNIALSSEYEEEPIYSELATSMWNTRGWVWQEQMVSQRLIVFGAKMIHVQCHDCILSENGMEPIGGPSSWYLHSSDWFPRSLKGSGWTNVISEFSQRKLSYSQDRLSAVAGLARKLMKEKELAAEPAQYLAGLWLNDHLCTEIMWRLCDHKPSFEDMIESFSNRHKYIAPSWSWASRNLAVTGAAYTGYRNPDLTVLDHDVQAAFSDPLVMVKYGSSITLRASSTPIPHRPSHGNFEDRSPRFCSSWQFSLTASSTITYYLDWDPRKSKYDKGEPEAQLVLLRTAGLMDDGFPLNGCMTGSVGLILLPAACHPDTVLYRVGTFRIDYDACESEPESKVEPYLPWQVRDFKII